MDKTVTTRNETKRNTNNIQWLKDRLDMLVGRVKNLESKLKKKG